MRIHRTGTALTGFAAAVVLGLSACSDAGTDTAPPGAELAEDEQEQGTGGEDITGEDALETLEPDSELVEPPAFAGGYGEDFRAEIDQYTGQQVTLSGTVGEVLQPGFFTLTSTEDTAVEPILVTGIEAPESIEADTSVEVTGTLEEGFEVADVEADQGVDLDDPLFEEYSGQPFLVTESIEVQEDPGA